MKRHWCKKSGVTLLEVVLTIMLIGIIGAVVLVRYQGVNANLIGETEALKAYLRFAQLRAMNTSTCWGIRFNNSTYWLFNTENPDQPILLPGVQEARISLAVQHGISIQLTNNSSENFWVVFDALGRPGTQIVEKEVIATSEDLVIALSGSADSNRSGTDAQSLVLTAQTGFIP